MCMHDRITNNTTQLIKYNKLLFITCNNNYDTYNKR